MFINVYSIQYRISFKNLSSELNANDKLSNVMNESESHVYIILLRDACESKRYVGYVRFTYS